MGEGLLAVEALSVRFGGVVAVDSVDLRVDAGGVVGLIGPNGAGKTTLIDALTGFTPPSSGRVRFDGADITSLRPAARAGLGLVRTFQSLELFEDLSVRDNLRVAAEPARWDDVLRDAVAPTRSAARVADDVGWALATVGIEALADARPRALSHGQRTLVAVARALAARPRLVLLDEPAAGLDRAETDALGARLAGLPVEGVAVLLVDHDTTLVLGTCERVVVLDAGAVIAEGPPEAVRTDPAVVAAYLGAPT